MHFMDMLKIYEKIVDRHQKIFFLPYTDDDQSSDFSHVLTEKERVRADNIKHHDSQKQFIFGRHLVRSVLNDKYHFDVKGKDFIYNEFGKPFIEGDIFFNLAHTKGLIILAVSNDRENGIDVEVNKNDNSTWTRYESYIKSQGKGLTYIEFKDFCVQNFDKTKIRTEIRTFNDVEYVWSCCSKF